MVGGQKDIFLIINGVKIAKRENHQGRKKDEGRFMNSVYLCAQVAYGFAASIQPPIYCVNRINSKIGGLPSRYNDI